MCTNVHPVIQLGLKDGNMILYIIITFFATVSVDILWSYYIRRVAQGKAFQAGLYAGLVYGNTVLITIL